jgi:hypothetical protein
MASFMRVLYWTLRAPRILEFSYIVLAWHLNQWFWNWTVFTWLNSCTFFFLQIMSTWELLVASISVYLAWALLMQVIHERNYCVLNLIFSIGWCHWQLPERHSFLCGIGDSDIIKTVPGDHWADFSSGSVILQQKYVLFL